MPHDKNGSELKPGDKVTLEMTVRDVYPGADMCNVSLVRAIEGEQQLSLTCQAAQTEKVGSSD
jgi:hypothetical protein